MHLLGIQNIQEDEDYVPDLRGVVHDDQDTPEHLEVDTELMMEAQVRIDEAGRCPPDATNMARVNEPTISRTKNSGTWADIKILAQSREHSWQQFTSPTWP